MSTDENSHEQISGPYSVICDFLEERNFHYTPDPEKKSIFLPIKSRTALVNCTLCVNDDDSLFEFKLRLPLVIENEKYRASTAELVTRANFCLPVGKFEFDYSRGDIRFQVHHFVGSFPLEKDVVDRIISSALRTADRYLPAIVQHVYAGVTPEDAVYAAELDFHAATVQETSP